MAEIGSDLRVLTDAGLRTGRYATYRPEFGVPVRTTVGPPRFWRFGPLVHARSVTPFGVFRSAKYVTTDEQRTAYLDHLDHHEGEVLAELAAIARSHWGEPLVLLCFEDVHRGEVCHRTWLAEWLHDRHGLDVSEVEVLPPAG
jgi:hypothetical protein